jgi:biotin synthase
MSYEQFAEKALWGEVLTESECNTILHAPETDLLPLLQAAFRVRKRYFGTGVKLHRLLNAKSGLCPEDCSYCSQSSISTASIDTYTLLPRAEILREAHQAVEAKALRFCIVTSGRGPAQRELEQIAEVVREIKKNLPLEICCSLGLLTPEQARTLKGAGVDRINHNLNTSEHHYPAICTTHTYRDRIDTLRNAKAAGLAICCGGIIGMGESDRDIIDLALALREIEVDSIPVNFLNPIEGTPLEGRNELTPWRCLKVLSLLRFLNPAREIRMAGGREINLRTLQPLALFVVDAMFVGGYLTTPGQASREAQQMIEEMGFHVEEMHLTPREAVP